MEPFVYLDQNTLSDLRVRKLEEHGCDNLFRLREILSRGQASLVYSPTHLEEIAQIPKQEFVDEHIDLLCELGALYISPASTELSGKDPSLVWRDFLQNEKDNAKMGINHVTTVYDKINRKFSGLPVEDSFEELNAQLKETLKSMLGAAQAKIEKMDFSALEESEVSEFISARDQLALQMSAVSDMASFDIDGQQELGPKPLRSHDKLKSLDLLNQPDSEVINLLDEIFLMENENYDWSKYFDDTVQNQIARCYSLMNWAGYFSDDFTRLKKNKDRFRASNNDLMHVRYAAGSTYLVSRDNAFLKKAKACYLYLNVPTHVIHLNEINNFLN